MATLVDPADCGPVTLALCQDVQTEAYDYPDTFFEARTWTMRRQRPDARELERAAEALRAAESPLIIAGGGVLYSEACDALSAFAERHGIPVAETQAGKSALPWSHPCSVGAIGVTGTEAANAIARTADLNSRDRYPVAGLHHRLVEPVPEPGREAGGDQRGGL